MVQCFLRNDRRLSFCEVMHFEAIRRKQDSTYQDVAFFRRRFVAFDGKKGEAEAGALYASRCDVFEKTFRSLPWKKKVTQEPLLYTGEKVKRTVLPSWQN